MTLYAAHRGVKCGKLLLLTPPHSPQPSFIQKRALWLTNHTASSPGDPRRTLSTTWRLATAVSDPNRQLSHELSAVPDQPATLCSTYPPPYPPSTLHSLCRGLSTCRLQITGWSRAGLKPRRQRGHFGEGSTCAGVVLGAAQRKERPKRRRDMPGAVVCSRSCLESLPGSEAAEFVF